MSQTSKETRCAENGSELKNVLPVALSDDPVNLNLMKLLVNCFSFLCQGLTHKLFISRQFSLPVVSQVEARQVDGQTGQSVGDSCELVVSQVEGRQVRDVL